MNAALITPVVAEPDGFWVPAMACQLASRGVYSKMTRAVNAGDGSVRADIVGAALREARGLVDCLEYLEREVRDA